MSLEISYYAEGPLHCPAIFENFLEKTCRWQKILFICKKTNMPSLLRCLTGIVLRPQNRFKRGYQESTAMWNGDSFIEELYFLVKGIGKTHRMSHNVYCC